MNDSQVYRIKDIAIIGSGSTPKSTNEAYYDGGTHPWLNTADVQDCVITSPHNFITDLAIKECNGLDYFPANTVILAMYGATLGNVGLLTFSSTLNQACCAMVLNKKALPKYLFYAIQSKKDYIISHGCGATQNNLSQKQISQFSFEFPNIKLQEQIVLYLDTTLQNIDSKISLLGKKKLFYKQLIRSIINETITKGLDSNVVLKDSGVEGIGLIPEHWGCSRFKELAYTTKGKQTDYLDEQVKNAEIVLTVDTIRQEIPSFYNYAIIPDKKQHCTSEDIVIIWDGAGVGEFLKAKDGVLSSTIAKITVNERKILKDYLWLWRYNIEYVLKNIPTGMGVPHLNPTLLNAFMIPVPPISEQRDIIKSVNDKCDNLDSAVKLLDAQIERYKLLKRSLINEVITGQRPIK